MNVVIVGVVGVATTILVDFAIRKYQWYQLLSVVKKESDIIFERMKADVILKATLEKKTSVDAETQTELQEEPVDFEKIYDFCFRVSKGKQPADAAETTPEPPLVDANKKLRRAITELSEANVRLYKANKAVMSQFSQ